MNAFKYTSPTCLDTQSSVDLVPYPNSYTFVSISLPHSLTLNKASFPVNCHLETLFLFSLLFETVDVTFNDIGGVNYFSYFFWKFIEWTYHIPVVFPASYCIWVFLPPFVLDFTKLLHCYFFVNCTVYFFKVLAESFYIFI